MQYPNLHDLIATLFPQTTARNSATLGILVSKLVRVYPLHSLVQEAQATGNIDLQTGIQDYVTRRGVQRRLSFSLDLHL